MVCFFFSGCLGRLCLILDRVSILKWKSRFCLRCGCVFPLSLLFLNFACVCSGLVGLHNLAETPWLLLKLDIVFCCRSIVLSRNAPWNVFWTATICGTWSFYCHGYWGLTLIFFIKSGNKCTLAELLLSYHIPSLIFVGCLIATSEFKIPKMQKNA